MSIGFRGLIVRLYEAWRSRAGVSVALPAFVAASFIMLFAIDPFGLEEASHARSEQATLRITSPWYDPSGQVTAVVIDDEYVRTRSAGWPLSYGDQGRLIRSILAMKPAVLVIDLVYPHRHAAAPAPPAVPGSQPVDSVSLLIDPIIAAAQADKPATPVVFTAMALEPGKLQPDFKFCPEETARTVESLLDESSIQRELLIQLTDPDRGPEKSLLRLAYVRWSGCGNRYPLLLGGRNASPTPAFEAFRVYCEMQKKYGRQLAACLAKPPADSADAYLQPMIVRSGAFPPSTQAFAYKKACQQFAERRQKKGAPGEPPVIEEYVPRLRKIWVSIEQASLGLFGDLRKDPRAALSLPCPAVTVVPLSVLESASADDLQELFTGKAVLLGANLSGIPDAVASQVHGQIPGVVWHAMALDNLISLGPGYLADRYEKQQRWLEIGLVVLFAYLFPFIMGWLELSAWKKILAAISFAVWCALALMELSAGHGWTALLALGIGIVLDVTKPTTSTGYFVAVIVAAICSAVSLRLGWPPGNWFGLVIVVIGFVHTIKPYFRGEERKHFPHTASILGPRLIALFALFKSLFKGDRI